MRDQGIRDPVHNLIKFSASRSEDILLWKLIQTSPLQRLRRIKQLGFTDFVYPGASHSRFSHVVGAMQMSRRMLGTFHSNQVIPSDEDTALMEQATACAALLHDVGHGPFSHVFEEVGRDRGLEKAHEEFTREIIGSDPIASILSSPPGSPDLLMKVIAFFEKDPGSTVYSTIVSSQLDADRLDFLCRDRYFTGVKGQEIDIEWLFDSLEIHEVPVEIEADATEWSLVVSRKGVPAVEQYLLAYSQLYSTVYFHKTTRSVQFLVGDIIKSVLDDQALNEELSQQAPLIQFFTGKNDLGSYLTLDDSAVLSLIGALANREYGRPTSLARRYLTRDLYKCFEPPHPVDGSPPPSRVMTFRQSLREAEIQFHHDVVPRKTYKQFEVNSEDFLENILVSPTGNPKDCVSIGSVSPVVKNLPTALTVRYYFYSEKDKAAAERIWNL